MYWHFLRASREPHAGRNSGRASLILARGAGLALEEIAAPFAAAGIAKLRFNAAHSVAG